MVVRFHSSRESTGLIIPKYCDYISFLLPQFYGNQKPHASGTHHSHHQLDDRVKEGSTSCDADGCKNEAIYKLPKSHKKACSLACSKWLKEHSGEAKHHLAASHHAVSHHAVAT